MRAVAATDQRCSARIALSEPSNWISMEAKAIKLHALKDALSGCSPRLKSKVLKDKMLDSVLKPMGMKSVSELRAAVSICVSPVPEVVDD